MKIKRMGYEAALALLVIVLMGGPLIYVGRWFWLHEKMGREIEAGQSEQVEHYRSRLFKEYKWARRWKLNYFLDKLLFRAVMQNEAVWLYEAGDYEAVLQKTAGIKEGWAHFLRGHAFFRKAVMTNPPFVSKEEALLDQAREEYLQAIMLDSRHFDAKFDYEIMSDRQLRRKVLEKQRVKMSGGQKNQNLPASPVKKPYNIEDINRSHGSGPNQKRG